MAISKKLRFEVFKRDAFTCQYCGRTPPEVTLEIDHINPKSKKGKDDINNLITSCFDCNRGKNNIPLKKIPNNLKNNYEILNEKELQLKEYNKLLAKIERRIHGEINKINEIYSSYFKDWCLSEIFCNNTLKAFLKKIPFSEVKDAMNKACYLIGNKYTYNEKASEDSIKYFCGICWNKIKEKTNPNYYKEIEVRKCWDSQPRGTHYLDNYKLKDWLNRYSVEEIKQAMNEAKGLWGKLRSKLDGKR